MSLQPILSHGTGRPCLQGRRIERRSLPARDRGYPSNDEQTNSNCGIRHPTLPYYQTRRTRKHQHRSTTRVTNISSKIAHAPYTTCKPTCSIPTAFRHHIHRDTLEPIINIPKPRLEARNRTYQGKSKAHNHFQRQMARPPVRGRRLPTPSRRGLAPRKQLLQTPWTALPTLVAKLRESGAAATVVAPYRPYKPWYQDEPHRLAAQTIHFPPARDLLFPGRLGKHAGVGPLGWSIVVFRVTLRRGSTPVVAQ
jgi:hypothetical protein